MNNIDIQSGNKAFWNNTADEWFGKTALPVIGVMMPTEDELHLFGDVSGKKMLEIGCGSGHSLVYNAAHGAGELWGIDISESQLKNARRLLDENGCKAKLVCAPMEDECGIPEGCFDVVYSIYAMGWTIDLSGAVKRIASYLKKDGLFIFSWRHPIAGCTAYADGQLTFTKSYLDQTWYPMEFFGSEMRLNDKRISDYVNALADAGFAIERMIEETDADTLSVKGEQTDKSRKARIMPHSFAFRARKIAI